MLAQFFYCRAKSLLPLRSLFFCRLNHRLALVVANGKVSAMFNEQLYGVIIHGSKDRGFAVIITGIHICAKLQQFLLHISEKSFMQRSISIVVAGVHIGASLRKETYTFHTRPVFIAVFDTLLAAKSAVCPLRSLTSSFGL